MLMMHDDATSNACYGHDFHCRDLEFSDIVPNTVTIFNYDKTKAKNRFSTGTLPLKCEFDLELCICNKFWLLYATVIFTYA